jgi:heptosyltransferase-1
MNRDIKKIAIVRLSALGDIVNSAVVLQFIKEKFPNASIEWIIEESFVSILKNLKEIENTHTINLKKVKKEKSLSLLLQNIKKLKALDSFDIIIDIQGLLKSSIVARLLGKNTHGFDKNSTRESIASFFYKTTTNIPYQSGVVLRNCAVVADALGFEITQKMILNKKPIFTIREEFTHPTQMVAFVIGASWQSKIYPKELVAEVCNTLKKDVTIIWGSQEEKLNAEWICENSEYALLAPKLSLDELVSYISSIDLLIGNDTGPTHIAWAQNIPSITLFGPTNERMIYETPVNVALKSPSKVNILKINKNDFSIKDIPYQSVVTQAKELLNGL